MTRSPLGVAGATLGGTVVSGDMPGADEKPPLGVPRSAGSPVTLRSRTVGADGVLGSGSYMPGADEKPPDDVPAATSGRLPLTPLALARSTLGVDARIGETPNGVAIKKANERAATGRLDRNMRGAPCERVVSISAHLDR
jgi:hypothetical protein